MSKKRKQQGGQHKAGAAPSSSPSPSRPPRKEQGSNLWLVLAAVGIGFTLAVFLLGGRKQPIDPTAINTRPADPAAAPQEGRPNPRSQASQRDSSTPARNILAAIDTSKDSFGGDEALATEFDGLVKAARDGKVPLGKMRQDVDAFKGKVGAGAGAGQVAVLSAQLALRNRDAAAALTTIDDALAGSPGSAQEPLEILKLQAKVDQLGPEGQPSAELMAELEDAEDDARGDEARALAAFTLARAQKAAGAKEDAMATYTRVASKYPRHQEAALSLMALGRMYEEAGKPSEAKDAFRQVVDRYPDLPYTKDAAQSLKMLSVVGEAAKDLNVKTWINGDPGKVTEQSGKVVLLLFWATWCPHCRNEMPEIIALNNKYKDQGLVIIGVTNEDDRQDEAKVREYAKEAGVNFPVAMQADRAGNKHYAIAGIPAAALVDKTGVIAWRNHPGQNIEAAIQKLLGS